MSYGADNLARELKKISELADKALDLSSNLNIGDTSDEIIKILNQIKEIAED